MHGTYDNIELYDTILSLFDDPAQGASIGWLSAFIQEVDVDVLGKWELALVDGLEQCEETWCGSAHCPFYVSINFLT